MDSETEQTTAPDGGQGQPNGDGTVDSDLSKLAPVIRFVEAEMQHRQRKTFDKDVDAAVEKIGAGDAFKGLPKNVIRRLTISHAFDNQDFDKAFQNRGEDPAAWDAALESARAVLAKDVKGLSAASVDGDGPSAARMFKMSDAEWQTFMEEELAKVS